jgi:hypothetical protein
MWGNEKFSETPARSLGDRNKDASNWEKIDGEVVSSV